MKDLYSNRKYVIAGLLLFISLIYIIRLFSLQVVNKSYRLSASSNVLRSVTQYPARGLIHDRNGELLVSNEAAYDLMVVPNQLQEFDTADFCAILNISVDDVRKRLKQARDYSFYTSSPFLKQISSKTYAVLQEKMFKFHGFFVQTRTLRKYTRKTASHALGYVSEVNEKAIKENAYYRLGDYIGKSGIEKSYEDVLRGRKGVSIYMVDVHGRKMGSYQEGKQNITAIVGKNIVTTLDADLQEYGELLMRNKIGSIVAIEPGTGEVLTLVSSPCYDPALLIGRIRSENFIKLQQDTLKPLFNRALMAQYPPGSTFKPTNGLIGLQEKVIYPSTEYYCDLGFYGGGIFVSCHSHDTPLNLPGAIQNSCNAYFCNVFRNILENRKYGSVAEAFNIWREYVMSFGFGSKLDSDFTNELKGFVPEASYYDKYYGKNGWSAMTLISLAIGQGELATTPLQMANMVTVIANRGFYYVPHIVKSIEGQSNIYSRFKEKRKTEIDSSHFEVIIKGMDWAVNGEPGSGSTARRARIGGITVCGKTGTAENPHGEDHSIFIAFAPKNEPKIALSVYVENGGWGSTYAAPIASLMIEKYLTDTITRGWLEEFILNTNLIDREEKSSTLE
ncbi:MAG: penicillin-binding protein 2 [Bacteroidales bacterium]|nr:penicillin-binding protein 2 [Bacteroidales bacterium]